MYMMYLKHLPQGIILESSMLLRFGGVMIFKDANLWHAQNKESVEWLSFFVLGFKMNDRKDYKNDVISYQQVHP